jgi:beta-galactosidase/beta-glucuronidase
MLVSEEMQKKEQINLIFDGLNTVANVSLNGHQLCACKNLFTRFVFPVTHLLKKVQITLKYSFELKTNNF